MLTAYQIVTQLIFFEDTYKPFFWGVGRWPKCYLSFIGSVWQHFKNLDIVRIIPVVNILNPNVSAFSCKP